MINTCVIQPMYRRRLARVSHQMDFRMERQKKEVQKKKGFHNLGGRSFRETIVYQWCVWVFGLSPCGGLRVCPYGA